MADADSAANPVNQPADTQQSSQTKQSDSGKKVVPIKVSKGTVLVFEVYFAMLSISATYVLWRIWPYANAPSTLTVFGIPLTFSTGDGDARLFLVALLTGALGALIHSITSFASYLGNRKLDGAWISWFTMRPIIGMILGLLFYLIVRAGLVTANGANGVNPFGVAAVAGLAGLFSKQTVDKLREVFENAFPVTKGDNERAGSLTDDGKVITTTTKTTTETNAPPSAIVPAATDAVVGPATTTTTTTETTPPVAGTAGSAPDTPPAPSADQ